MGTSNTEGVAAMLQMPRGTTKEQAFELCEQSKDKEGYSGIDAALLECELDMELVERLLEFCSSCPNDASLRVAHNDLGSGKDVEQLIFEKLAERNVREGEKKMNEQKKRDSAKQKDFGISAGMRRAGDEGIKVAVARLAALDEVLEELNRRKKETPWYALFSRLEGRKRNSVVQLDLSNCGLHCTGLNMLSNVMCELEQRGDGEKIQELILDGNALEDIGMTPIASLLRLSKELQVLRLRNVGITERGISQVLSSLVGNKKIQLVDLRGNGLASTEVTKAAVDGVRRFNNFTQILL